MEPAGGWDTQGRHHPSVLQVSLTPAAVADHHIDQRWWRFLETVLQVRIETYALTRASQQRRLDKVVTEDVVPERGLPARWGRRQFAVNAAVRMIAL
jgi:hypothetical protein